MAGPGNITIKVGAETAGAVRELGNLESSLGQTMTKGQKVTAGLKKAALPAAAALTAIGAGAKVAISAASDLNEQINKAGAVFDQSAPSVVAWSKTLTESFGMSQTAALEAAGTFGNMLVPMGFAPAEAAKMSKSMVELAGDLASFNNASPEETLAALQSGLAGQSEPLRKFGVFLDDARLKQEALRQGLYDGKGAMSAAAKASATLAIVLKDTTDAQGDFARTSSGAANQARIQKAQMQDLSAQLGQALLPSYIALQKVLLAVTRFTSEHTKAVQILVGAVAVLAGGILAANAAIKAYQAIQIAVKVATAAWTAAQWLLNAALSANPIGIVVVAVAALAAGLVVAYTKSETFRNVVHGAMKAVEGAVDSLKQAFNQLREAAFQAWDWVQDHWKLALFAFGPVGAAVYVISENFDKIKAAAAAAAGAMKDVAGFTFSGVTAAVEAIAGAFRGVTRAINDVIDAVRNLIDWISRIHIPKIKLPHIPGVNLAAAPSTAGYGRAAAAGATNGGGGVTINVYGAIDPEGTARTIRRILRSSDLRTGRIIA